MMKALFFDIDGTLIDINTHRIPESTTQALRQAKARGNKIFIATGRSHTIVELPGLPKEVVDGYVTLNGAICLVDDVPVSLMPIPKEVVRDFSKVCVDRGLTALFITMEGMRVANGNADFVKGFQEYFNLAPIPSTDFTSMLDLDVYQMTTFFPESDDPELKARFPQLEFNRWFPTFADITCKGVDKAMGIEKMAGHFGIDLKNTIAFGDGGNDIPMLCRAGISVAMGNASDQVKANADLVTSNVSDDGIQKALKALRII